MTIYEYVFVHFISLQDAIATALVGNHILKELFEKPINAEIINGIQEKDAK